MRPLARPFTELTVACVVALVSGVAGFAALLALDDPREVLLGFALGLAFMAAWLPGASVARSRRRTAAGTEGLRLAPPEAPREEASATVRRMLTGWVRVFPVVVLLIVLPTLVYGPTPGNGGILAGATIGTIVGSGLDCLRRAARLARWERAHDQTILLEQQARFRRPWQRKRRRVYVEPGR